MLARSVLTVDVGGSNVKMSWSGSADCRSFPSGKRLSARRMVEGVLELARDWPYDTVSVGVPAQVLVGRVVHEPVNLGSGWAGFDYEQAFGKPTRVVNDAAMQALGSYDGGTMLFLGLGTGLGSAVVVHGLVEPLELGHLPFRKRTFEDYVGARALERLGRKRWRRSVVEVIEALSTALDPDYVVVGGGNVDALDELPPRVRRGGNENAFVGGFRLWDEAFAPRVP